MARVRTTVDSSCPSLAETCMTYCGCPFTRLPQASTVFPTGAAGPVQSGSTSGRWLQRLVVMVTDSNCSANGFHIHTGFPSKRDQKTVYLGRVLNRKRRIMATIIVSWFTRNNRWYCILQPFTEHMHTLGPWETADMVIMNRTVSVSVYVNTREGRAWWALQPDLKRR